MGASLARVLVRFYSRFVPSDLSQSEMEKKINVQVGYLRIFIAIYASQKNTPGQTLFHVGPNLVTIEKFDRINIHRGTQSTDTPGCESRHAMRNTNFRLKIM